MPRKSPYRQEFTLHQGVIRCAGCNARMVSSAITHTPGCKALCRGHSSDSGDDATWDIDVTLDLAELGLQHRPKAGCSCGGHHEVTLGIRPEAHRFVPEEDVPAISADWQALHEQAHPDGTLYVENCRERGCVDA